MKKFIIIAILIFAVMMSFGWQKAAVIDEPAAEPETLPEEQAEEEPLTDYYGELMIAIENGDLIEIEKLMVAFMPMIDEKQADDILEKNINLKKAKLPELTQIYYSEQYYELHNALYEATKNANVEFASPYGLVGKSKGMILDLIDDPSFRELVESTFDQGYGLLMAEGTYYPVVDYVILDQTFAELVSGPMSDYLDLMKNEQHSRTLVEEYLAVSIDELTERAVKYETFLNDNRGFAFNEDIKISLMVVIYKFAMPTPFDGLLDESYRLSKGLENSYEILKGNTECPVIQYVATEMTAFSEEMGGVLGSYQNMDDLFTQGFAIHQTAGEMIDDLYFGE